MYLRSLSNHEITSCLGFTTLGQLTVEYYTAKKKDKLESFVGRHSHTIWGLLWLL